MSQISYKIFRRKLPNVNSSNRILSLPLQPFNTHRGANKNIFNISDIDHLVHGTHNLHTDYQAGHISKKKYSVRCKLLSFLAPILPVRHQPQPPRRRSLPNIVLASHHADRGVRCHRLPHHHWHAAHGHNAPGCHFCSLADLRGPATNSQSYRQEY